MTGKELADQYRGTIVDVLRLRDEVRKLIDEQVAEHGTIGITDQDSTMAGVMVGKFCVDIGPQRDELEHTMAVSDVPLSLAIGCMIAAFCALGAFYLREHALGEGRRTNGLTAAIIATASLTRAIEVLLKRLDRVEEMT